MKKEKTEIVILGAGPGGYMAAFVAAAKGKSVTLVEMDAVGGVCLNRGCIPSKTLIHATEVMHEALKLSECGIHFQKPKVVLQELREWKERVVSTLCKGLAGKLTQKKITILNGRGFFESEKLLRVETKNGQVFLEFEYAIIATGSSPAIPAQFDLGSLSVMDSTQALALEDVPTSLLVIGGGYIGMELGFVYANLGSKVTVVELGSGILMGADPDLVKPVFKKASQLFENIYLETKVLGLKTEKNKIKVEFEKEGQKQVEFFDKVLVSVGRSPNSKNMGLKEIGLQLTDQGFIEVNEHQQSVHPHIYAIGDIAGGVLLAHKAYKEAHIAVEHLMGDLTSHRVPLIIPAVVFTDPELAWCGLTEVEARSKQMDIDIVKFPWTASGRAMSLNRTDGLTKLILEKETGRVLGVGIVGVGCSELISEAMVAIEMGATVNDLGMIVHPHPTLSESLMEAAEQFLHSRT